MNNTPNHNRNTSGAGRPTQPQANRNAQSSGRPAGTQQRPAGTTQRPASNGQRPASSAQRPANGQHPAGTQRPANGQRPAQSHSTQGARKPNGKKSNKKKNKDFILTVLALLLVVALAITILVCCVKAIIDTVNKNNNTSGSDVTTSGTIATTEPKDLVYPTPAPGAWNEGFTTISRNNTAIHEGDLILVNNNYEYTFPATNKLVEMYGQPGQKDGTYVLGSGMTYPTGAKPLELSKHIASAADKMLADLKAAVPDSLTSDRKLMISSGYRTLEKQQSLYDKETVEGLTAKPGHSEHHTGLALDIRINIKSASKTEYLNEAEQAWITENCAKYGFILRYTDEKKDITGILDEDWHFRYVGVAHATYMTENDLCLEQYIAYLSENHLYGFKDPLNYTVGDKSYIIYYIPASVEKEETDIYVPELPANYEISGNNVDGFIVTITK